MSEPTTASVTVPDPDATARWTVAIGVKDGFVTLQLFGQPAIVSVPPKVARRIAELITVAADRADPGGPDRDGT